VIEPDDEAFTIAHLRADLGTIEAVVLLFSDGNHQIQWKSKGSTAWKYAPLTRTSDPRLPKE
jgi:hypothetical protein